MTAPRQLALDGSLAPLACVHRARRGRDTTLLLRTGQIGTVQACRCGQVRFRVRSLRGELEWSAWRERHAHGELPSELPSLLSSSAKP